MKAFSRFGTVGIAVATVATISIGVSNGSFAGPKKSAGPEPASKAASKAPPAAAPAEKEKLTYDGPPVMDPSRYYGAAAMGYAAAKAAPEVMAKLFCYCGCDETDKHSYLIDCFTGNHGMDCHICQEEAVLALRLYRDGASIAEIQKRVDNDYSKYYPFDKDTESYAKYKAMRLWNPIGAAPGLLADTGKEKPKVKPGMTVGQCCSSGEHNGHNEKKK